jgi:hypothetical protein
MLVQSKHIFDRSLLPAVFASHSIQYRPPVHCPCTTVSNTAQTPSLSFSWHPTNPRNSSITVLHPPILSNILRQLIRSPIQLSRNQPKLDLATPMSVQIDLRQQRFPQISVGDRLASGIPPATLSPLTDMVCDSFDQIGAV